MRIICLFFLWKVNQKDYASTCAATVECKAALGLYCSTTGNQCECPTSLPAGNCDCTSTQYYKDATSGCGIYFIFK